MNELIGKECIVDFNLPAMEWPIKGWPAQATVEAVDMPMIKLQPRFCGAPIWVNSAIIKTIRPA